MRKKLKTEITLQIEEVVAIRPHRVLIVYCPRCRGQARMVAANDAATLARLSAREVYRLVETGRLHFIEDQDGRLYVCSESLKSFRDSGR